MELYIRNNQLIPEKEWKAKISKLKKEVNNKEIKNKRLIKKLLTEKLTTAIKKRIPKEKFGILFSGGIDSSLIAFICSKFTKNFICYSVGLEKSKDLEFIKNIKLNFKIKIKILPLREAEKIIKNVKKIISKPDVVKIGVGSVLYSVAEMAKMDKVKILFSGLGSEEIFAGYERHKVKDINKECWSGLKSMRERDLERDYKLSSKLKIKLLTPFLDEELIKVAMQIPGIYKIRNNQKKYILREVSADLKLPKEICWRKKTAAQYGSGFDKAIEKLARKKGFKYKKDYVTECI